MLDVLDSDEFIDQPPREVYARLLSRGVYLCSVSTMYRILRERGPVRERRQQKQRTKHPVPRLEAVAPNQVWTWDITKLATFTHGVFLNLYVILDLYSRFVVAWMLAERENSALAIQLLRDAITRYEIPAAQLSVHQDRGAPMRAVGFQQVLQDLGVSQSYSRPRVSNDNPYSEAHFRTLKYQSDYPHRFRGVQEARTWCADFFAWYNEAHHHVGLGLHTPADVYFDRAKTIAAARQLTLNAAYQRNPARFVNGPPKAALPPERVAINPIDPGELVTAERILTARESELVALAPTPTLSTAPTVNLPGLAKALGAARDHAITI